MKNMKSEITIACTDSYCGLYGASTESWNGFDLNEGYLIDSSY